ncbi:16S rRNA processing protein RimM [Litoreibacter halocynthiae]|uniref:Ribosome maturation factor RimM n=1 Tax=Litoreibacter halocynthiae TaxID=1242689 RepID=A0A4R7LHU2_9RHOB|nr:ribosome maturation factor RimM [Litoreibacter halocynthiae]TDT75357.1 16S rRNA processing protein RimM [Litoreibacter halocynthiae]
MSKDKIVVGAIAGSFGVKGEVRLKSFCATPEDIALYSPLTGDNGVEYTLKITRQVKNGFAARLSGIRFKDEADALRGVKLSADRDLLPSLPDDEYYHADLMGLDVLDTGGEVIGKVAAVLNHGAGDILELRGPGLKGSVLLPFTLDAVPTVDLAAKRIIIDPPEGLLD